MSLAPRSDVLWAYPASVGIVDRTNAQMVHRERLLLYSTVLALVPERCLEVGVCEGGSSRIIHAALNDLGRGLLVSIDPHLRVTLSMGLASSTSFDTTQGLMDAADHWLYEAKHHGRNQVQPVAVAPVE